MSPAPEHWSTMYSTKSVLLAIFKDIVRQQAVEHISLYLLLEGLIIEIIESPRQIELQAETDLPVTILCVPEGQGVTAPGQVSPGVIKT